MEHRQPTTHSSRLILGLVALIFSPLVGGGAIGLSVMLSDTSWEDPDPGSPKRFLAWLVLLGWAWAVYRLGRTSLTRATAVATAVAATVWSVAFWWLAVTVLSR